MLMVYLDGQRQWLAYTEVCYLLPSIIPAAPGSWIVIIVMYFHTPTQLWMCLGGFNIKHHTQSNNSNMFDWSIGVASGAPDVWNIK